MFSPLAHVRRAVCESRIILMCPRDERKQLAHDRVGRRRAEQATLQKTECLWPLSPFDGDRAQVEEDERDRPAGLPKA